MARLSFSKILIYACLTIFVSQVVHAEDASRPRGPSTRRKAVQHRARTDQTSSLTDNSTLPQPTLRRWEVSTAPLALIAQWYTLDASFRLDSHWSTGPAFVSYQASPSGNMFLPSYRGSALGWQGRYSFQSVESNTWYISAHAYYDVFKSYLEAVTGYNDKKGTRLNSAAGYQWHGSRINVLSGVGLESRNYDVTEVRDNIGGSTVVTKSTEATTAPFVELKLGYEF